MVDLSGRRPHIEGPTTSAIDAASALRPRENAALNVGESACVK